MSTLHCLGVKSSKFKVARLQKPSRSHGCCDRCATAAGVGLHVLRLLRFLVTYVFGVYVELVLFIVIHSERFTDLFVLEQLANSRENASEPQKSDHDPHAHRQTIPCPISRRRILTWTRNRILERRKFRHLFLLQQRCPHRSHLGRARRYPSRQRMHSSTACASCAMSTTDKSSYSD